MSEVRRNQGTLRRNRRFLPIRLGMNKYTFSFASSTRDVDFVLLGEDFCAVPFTSGDSSPEDWAANAAFCLLVRAAILSNNPGGRVTRIRDKDRARKCDAGGRTCGRRAQGGLIRESPRWRAGQAGQDTRPDRMGQGCWRFT